MHRLLNLPLRILIPAILVVFSTLVSLGVTLERLNREEVDIRSASEINMIEIVQQLQDAISDRMLHNDLTAANMRLSDTALARNIVGLYLIDAQGNVVLSSEYALRGSNARSVLPIYSPDQAQKSLRHERGIVDVTSDDKLMLGYFPVVLGQAQGSLRPTQYGVLFVEYDLGALLAQARNYALHQSLTFFVAYMLFTVLLALFFRWRVTLRVESLTRVVSQFSGGELDQRSTLKGDDELARLARAFNGMADRLTEKNQQLEQEIQVRTQVAAELRSSRKMLQLVLDSIPVGVFWKDKALNYQGCNRLFAHDAGLPSPESVVGLREANLVWQQLASRYEADDLKVISSGQGKLHSEESTLMPDGTEIWLQISKIPLFDEHGEITGLLGTYQDITARKRADAALRKFADEVEDLYENAPCGYHSLDSEGVFRRINRTELDWLGYAREDVVGKLAFPDLLTPESLESFSEHYPLFKETGSVRDLEFELIRKDGTVLPVLVSATAIYDEQHRYVASRSTIYDITDRKRSEEARRAASLYARSLIEASLDPLVTINVEGKIMDVNLAMETATGLPRERLIGSDFASYFTDPGKARAGYRQTFSQGTVTDYALVIRHVSNSTMDVLFNAAVYRNEKGEVAGIFAAARNVTELKRAEDALEQLNATLEQRVQDELAKNREKDHLLIQQSRLAAMGEMVHNIAHQWRQPLNLLGLVIGGIRDDYDHGELNDETLKQAIEQSQRLLQKMSTTIDDFRNFFRPDKEKQSFDIAHVIDETIVLMEASLKNNHIGLELDIERPVPVDGYPSQYSQALLNILVNAKEAILQNRVAVGKIRIALKRGGEQAVLTVEDNGGGIPQEAMPRLFDPYFTTKQQGSGIGLYMTKMIIENSMNGKVWAENADTGARFSIALPMSAARQSTPRQDSAQEQH